ncbi:uncharacterized protein DS421_3g103990 [Arachis hypogaea]|nr:uncharacterized protein DS421_3g103990 [Arachis hypogaea]
MKTGVEPADNQSVEPNRDPAGFWAGQQNAAVRRRPVTSVEQSPPSRSHLLRPVTSVVQQPLFVGTITSITQQPSSLEGAPPLLEAVAQPVTSITRRRYLPSPTLPIACSVLEVLKVPSSFQEFQGDVSGSLVEFDRAIELDPRQKAYLWQRGLSLYYLDRFEEGAEQFRLDVAQNSNDTEESIWCFLCEAQLYGVDEARKRYLEVSH